jgi:hypothetical protein
MGTKLLFSGFHRAITGGNGHRAKHDTAVAVLTEGRPFTEGKINMPFFPPPNETDCVRLPDFRANANAATTKNALLIAERIPDLLHSAAYGDILDSAGIRSVGHQQFSKVAPQAAYPLGICKYHHSLSDLEGT